MNNVNNSGDFSNYLTNLYSGMFAGVLFIAAVAGCIGFVNSIGDMLGVLSLCLASVIVFSVADQATR